MSQMYTQGDFLGRKLNGVCISRGIFSVFSALATLYNYMHGDFPEGMNHSVMNFYTFEECSLVLVDVTENVT